MKTEYISLSQGLEWWEDCQINFIRDSIPSDDCFFFLTNGMVQMTDFLHHIKKGNIPMYGEAINSLDTQSDNYQEYPNILKLDKKDISVDELIPIGEDFYHYLHINDEDDDKLSHGLIGKYKIVSSSIRQVNYDTLYTMCGKVKYIYLSLKYKEFIEFIRKVIDESKDDNNLEDN